ncbi:MAG: MarR family transcriptional regulator [SAR86 cluster bacterium]|uniref:MarR family transcriptional regulator n=1 Tax=SAR86 cluster bacterium TaxID=2030880 RepID=A0A2A5AJH4_9GAMM|nr:MAG: MarR family transcriptional regulator [SAR86 cluster bacterium]
MSKPQFNELIHAPKRLRICAFLAAVKEVEFKVLAEALILKDSDLSKQIKLLEQSGYVNSRKVIVNTRQKTWLAFSDEGRETFNAHVKALREIL